MNKEILAELITAYRLAVSMFKERKEQSKYFCNLTGKGTGYFNVIENYIKSRQIQKLRAL
jgi:hypothetical protein